MITEADALDLAQTDSNIVRKKANKGAMPDQIGKLAVKCFLRRVDSLGNPGLSKRARQGAMQRIAAPTFSEFILAQIMNVLSAVLRNHPEDTRALILWLNGAPPAPGFLAHLVDTLGESSGQEALQRCQTTMNDILQKMQRADTELFEIQIKKLNSPRRRIIRGFLLDAQWAFSERDGIMARNHVIRARRITVKWLREAAVLEERLAS